VGFAYVFFSKSTLKDKLVF